MRRPVNMPPLLFLFCMLAPVFVCCQRCDSIEWSGHHHLKWRNFKAQPDMNAYASALSEVHIYYECASTANFAKIRVTCNFSPCGSWVKSGPTQDLLEHEQTHFDIAEYHKRLLVKEILSQRFSSDDVMPRVKAIGEDIREMRRKADELYDLDTRHSMNRQAQKKWTKKVKKLVRQLNAFEKPDYIIKLG